MACANDTADSSESNRLQETVTVNEVIDNQIAPNLGEGADSIQRQNDGPTATSQVQRQRRPNKRNRQSQQPKDGKGNAARFPDEYRTIDGLGNNINNPSWGAAGTVFIRMAPPRYEDGNSVPAGQDRPSARAVSNAVIDQADDRFNEERASDYLWQWGQFLDHDIDETPVASPEEPLDIVVPTGDAWFDPTNSGAVTIPLDRSAYDTVDGVREQVNEISAYIDGTNVYGSDEERNTALRTKDGTGKLLTSDGDLLPFNTAGLANAPSNAPNFFLAGDIRANEQVGLAAMHTLFVREHNHWADVIAGENPELSGDEVYEHARAIVIAEMQVITYREFLPLLLGTDALPPYQGYNPNIDAGIANEFATAAYRMGHSMLSPELLRIAANGNEVASGHLQLADAFFNPTEIIDNGIDTVLRGLAAQRAQRVDVAVIDDVRNFLFGPPGAGGFDLPALNIQRGRDHGLPTLNGMRIALGLPAHATFGDVTSDADVQTNLSAIYDSVNDIDLWVGGLAEDHHQNAMVGETWHAILVDQFVRLRDGDRFWYQAYLPPPLVRMVEEESLARIIRRNTGIGNELANDVFRVPTDDIPPRQSNQPRLDGNPPATEEPRER
ncbi:MAG: peroxidase family protein [Phycisphaerae bacterium]